jgi:hypothetical protein
VGPLAAVTVRDAAAEHDDDDGDDVADDRVMVRNVDLSSISNI